MTNAHLLEIERCYAQMQALSPQGLFGMKYVVKAAGENAAQARDREVMERRDALIQFRALFAEMGKILERARD